MPFGDRLEKLPVLLMRQHLRDLVRFDPPRLRVLRVHRRQMRLRSPEHEEVDRLQLRSVLAAVPPQARPAVAAEFRDQLKVADARLLVNLAPRSRQRVLAVLDVTFRQRPTRPVLADDQNLSLLVHDDPAGTPRLDHLPTIPSNPKQLDLFPLNLKRTRVTFTRFRLKSRVKQSVAFIR